MGWVLSALVVAGLAFAVVAVVTGRGEVMADMPADAAPGLPPGPIDPREVAAARFDLAFRGYRMDQVDALLDRLSAELTARDGEIAMLRRPKPNPMPATQEGHDRA